MSRGGTGQVFPFLGRRYALPLMHQAPVYPLPDLVGRIAVLGGRLQDRTALCLSLAQRQAEHRGVVVCLDAHRRQQLEMPFRLLFRGRASYIPLSAGGNVPNSVAQQVLQTLQKGLGGGTVPPPLLLVDGVRETPDWEHTLTFFLRTGMVVVEFLQAQDALVFGRYETTILLRADEADAEAISQTVGRKVASEDLQTLKKNEGYLMHLSQVYRVQFPERQ